MEYLSANSWEVEAAVTEFFTDQDEALHENVGDYSGSDETRPSVGRTLGGASVPAPAKPSTSSRKSAPRRKGVATLGDFASAGHDDSEGEDDTENQDFFAGGGKSGLAVQNPDDVRRKIIEKAER